MKAASSANPTPTSQTRKLYAVTFLFLLSSLPVFPQASTGTINVDVKDQSGALVPGASVTLTHTSTGLKRQGVSNSEGIFVGSFMPIGSYSLEVSYAGFKTATLPQLEVRVDQDITIPVSLQPGELRETVQVSDSTPLLETSDATLGQVIENKKILELPLNGRNPFALGLLSGNTVAVFGMGTNLPFVGGGGRYSAMDVMIDGVDDNTTVNNGSIGRNGIAYTPPVDAVQEFKVQTSAYSAEFGHSAGTVVNATIKSGTNQFHGTLYEFLRNDKLDANNFLGNASGLAKAPYRQNQFGGVIGGPVIKNNTFFFFDYQETRRRTRAGTTIGSVPTNAFRQGDFSGLGTTIFDPGTRRIGPSGAVIADPYARNQIPLNQINPTSLAVEGLVPAPDFGSPGATSRNYFAQLPQLFNEAQWDLRIDQKISSNNNLYGRFSLANQYAPTPGLFPGFIGGFTTNIDDTRQFVLADTWILTPSIVNDFRFGYLRHNGSILGSAPSGLDFAKQNKLATFPFPEQGFPALYFLYSGIWSSPTAFNTWGGGNSNKNIENHFQWADTINITHGKHSMKTGVDLRRPQFATLKGDPFYGALLFGSIFTSSSSLQGSGSPYADFLLGYPAGVQATQMLAWGNQREIYYGQYFQDDWKISSKFTLNLGIRYDLFTQPVDARNVGGVFIPSLGQFVRPGTNGYSRAVVDGDHNNWAPRVGFAYQITPKLVLRGGYGLYYGLRDQNQEVTQFSGANPNIPNISFPAISATQTIAPPVTINTPLTVLPTDPTLSGFTPSKPYGTLVRFEDVKQSKDPGLHQANVSLQYQPSSTWLFQVDLSAARGFDLASAFINLNQVSFAQALAGQTTQAQRPFPNINNAVLDVASIGNSRYNAANVKVEKRYSYGLTMLVNYSWQKNIETRGTGPSSYTQIGNSQALDSTDLAREESVAPLDITHVFSATWGYELPWGQGRRWLATGLLGKIVGGWQINGIGTLHGGFPTDIFASVQASVFNSFNVPDRVLGQSTTVANPGPDAWFNGAAFSVPGKTVSSTGAVLQDIGNSSRRVARGPGLANLDFSIFRELLFKERFRFQFRGEFFNLTNTPAFLLPSANDSTLTCIGTGPGAACNSANSNFGKLSDGSATGRQIQFGLKFLF